MPGRDEEVKSKAQQRWAFAAERKGELAPGTAKRWAKSGKEYKSLPARINKTSNYKIAVAGDVLGKVLFAGKLSKKPVIRKLKTDEKEELKQKVLSKVLSKEYEKKSMVEAAYLLGQELFKVGFVVDNLYNSDNPVKDLAKMIKKLPEEKFIKRKKKQKSLLMTDIFSRGAPRQKRPWSYVI